MIRLVYWPLQVLGLAYILLVAAFPRVAWPATPSPAPTPFTHGCTWEQGLLACIVPTPAPQPSVPVDLDRFCETHGAGPYRGLLLSRSVPHVTILCARADYECLRTCEHPIRHFQGTP